MAEWHFIMYMCYSSVDGYLDGLHFLAIINNAAMNIGVLYLFFLFIDFIGVTLVNKIIQVSDAQFYNTPSVHCIHHPKSLSITICSP